MGYCKQENLMFYQAIGIYFGSQDRYLYLYLLLHQIHIT
jgi:hypothetical protein